MFNRARDFLSGWTHSARWLWWVNLLCAVGLCAVSAVLLWDLRTDAERQSEITSRSLIQVLGRDIARNISVYDLALQAVVVGLHRPEVSALSPELRRMILFDHAATAPGFGRIVVLDAHGDATIGSEPLMKPFHCSDCEGFRYFSTHADDTLRISSPTVSRLTGRRVVTLTRRLSNPDGSFAGIVSGAILLDYFGCVFAAVGADHAGVVTLYGGDGTIIMRSPFKEADIGASVATTPSYLTLKKIRNGSFVGPAMIGGGNRHFVVTQVGDLPLMLSIAVSPGDIYAGWWWKAISLGAVVLGLSAFTVLLTWLFRRELEERKHAERTTAAINIELEKLAVTDALTGLYNRRRFDEVLSREWRRALRTQQPLAVLLLDADWFKGFNDRYGHQKGDEALKLIARAIESSIDPASDIACRIGGEEFAVIFPDTSSTSAEIAANRIRDAIRAWRIPHGASDYDVLTVSGGLAQRTHMPLVDKASDLVAAADNALYEAKLAGRNRIHVADRLPPPALHAIAV